MKNHPPIRRFVCEEIQIGLIAAIILSPILLMSMTMPASAVCSPGFFYALRGTTTPDPSSGRVGVGVQGYSRIYDNFIYLENVAESVVAFQPNANWIAVGWEEDITLGFRYYTDWNKVGTYGKVVHGNAPVDTSHLFTVEASPLWAGQWETFIDGSWKHTEGGFNYDYTAHVNAQSESKNTCNSLSGHYWILQYRQVILMFGSRSWVDWSSYTIRHEDPPYYVIEYLPTEFVTGGQGS